MTADPRETHRMLALAAEHIAEPSVRAQVQRQAAAVWQDLQRQRVVVFGLFPGYVVVGVEGEERELPHPGLGGLELARRIFLAGPQAVHALDLLPEPCAYPANALQGLLRRAADWVEHTGRCPELAAAMRSPSIAVSRDGWVTYTPGRRIKLV